MTLPEFKVSRGHHVFENLIARCADLKPVSVAVCHPCDEVSLDAARWKPPKPA